MIRFIAAIDSKQGLANEKGIPWVLPTDLQYFREQTSGGIVLMGYRTYEEFKSPLPMRRNLVATSKSHDLHPGFKKVSDTREFLSKAEEDIWVIGGAGLFASTLDLADELYLTELEGDFHCTKFFPEFKDNFELTKKGEPLTENGITFRFSMYRRKS